MKRKIIGFLVCLILIAPISSAIGISQDTELASNQIVAETDIDADIVNMITQVNESLVSNYLEGLVSMGGRYTGSKNCRRAAEYIYDEFEKMGLDVYFDEWKYLRFRCRNVVATLNGTDPSSDAVFIICAHYDSIGSGWGWINIGKGLGANDDGSGVAAILTIANILSKYSFNHTIRFIALSGEEVGTYGSHAYAKRAYEQNENIIAVLDIDMIGYANTTIGGKTLQILKTRRTEWISLFSDEVSQRYEEYIDLRVKSIPNFPCDHQAFLDFGYDAVMYTEDDSYLWLHSLEDTLDKINYTYFVKVTRLLLAVAAELADKPIDVQVRIVTPSEGCFYLFNQQLLRLPGFNIYRTELRGITYILGKTTVRVNVSSEEEIEDVYLCIDDNGIISMKPMPPYEWELQGFVSPLLGKHTLSVYACTKSGKTAYDEMDIYSVTLSPFVTLRIFPRVIN